MDCVRNCISELDAKCIVMLNGGGTPAGGLIYKFGYDKDEPEILGQLSETFTPCTIA